MRVPKPANEPLRDGSSVGSERAVLVGILLPDTKADLRDPLGELSALARTAGANVVDAMIQKRTNLTTAFGLGKGKVRELHERATANEADVAIFDNDLTPRQIRGIERECGIKVIDRSELILDIFASRAKTHAAQLQVELAQLEYTAPRIRGMWTHLERIAGVGGATAAGAVGGVGTRGPGERQIEIDRRLVRKRIAYLKREIAEIDRRKQQEVRSRGDEYTVSLVGYTNSGKTTLLNKLTGAGRFTADILFATLDTKTARWALGDGREVLLSDTVGFVRDLPHKLVASFRATLEETIHANLLIHVVDASSPQALAQVDAVEDVLEEIGCGKRPVLMVLNKMDIVDDASIPDMLAIRRPGALRISAANGTGLDELAAGVLDLLAKDAVSATVHVPHTEGKLLAEIDRRAEVLARRYRDDGVELDVRIDRAQLRHICGRHDTISVLRSDSDPADELDFA
jgi:GTP-binding protein HflX